MADGQATYQYGAGLVSEVRGGTSKVYHADSLGTPRAMSNASGTATDTLETDAFGNVTRSTGSTPSPFGFAGQHGYQTDSDSGLMLLGHRYYDASVGRFISRDPIRAGHNWYVYCNGDPVNGIDPKGLSIVDWVKGVLQKAKAVWDDQMSGPRTGASDDASVGAGKNAQGEWVVPDDGRQPGDPVPGEIGGGAAAGGGAAEGAAGAAEGAAGAAGAAGAEICFPVIFFIVPMRKLMNGSDDSSHGMA